MCSWTGSAARAVKLIAANAKSAIAHIIAVRVLNSNHAFISLWLQLANANEAGRSI